jgi:phosphatidylcholine synthase
LWNAAAFYLFLLHPSPALASLGVAGLIVLTFVPLHVIHPVRVARLRGFNLALMAVWGVLAIVTLARDFDVTAPISVGLCAIALYVVGADAVIRLLRP